MTSSDIPLQWRFDHGNLMAPRLQGFGLSPEALTGTLAERFAEAQRLVDAWREEGRLGFIDLPLSTAAADSIRMAERVGQNVRDVVVLGIGGSALGTRALRDALGGVRWNESSIEHRHGRPRLHVLDNPDPDFYRASIAGLDPATTLVNVISKSGGTAETLALYQTLRTWMERAIGDRGTRDRLVFTTDPTRGPLRAIAERDGLATLEVPPNVGGRFSVLSAVGLFPVALLGFDAAGLLDGAREMEEASCQPVLSQNPAALLASALHSFDVDHGCFIHVLMPYRSRLATLALWFQQLWAESLGKVRADGRSVGPTPLPGVGASDQHAQVQLFMEGPRDKVVVFVSAPSAVDEIIPDRHPEEEALSLLAGHGLGELLEVERVATAEALRQAGRPNATLELGGSDAAHMGATLHLLQRATVFAGALYDIDPLDQPGVELGKQLTRARLATRGPVGDEGEPSREWVLDGGFSGKS